VSDLMYFDDVGDHQHRLLRTAGVTASDGSHAHVWYVPVDMDLGGGRMVRANTLLMSSYDGAHSHALAGDSTAKDGAHLHGVPMGGGRLMASSSDGQHDHMLLVSRTGSVGMHPHVLEIGGKQLTSLMPADILALLAASDAGSIDEPVLRSSLEGAAIYHKGERVSHHKSLTEAGACMAALTLILRSGLDVNLDMDNVRASGWLVKLGLELVVAKRLETLQQEKSSGGGIGDKMARALETLGRD